MNTKTLQQLVAVCALLATACASHGPAAPPSARPEAPVLVGEVTREEVEAVVPEWVAVEVRSEIDAESARQLAIVPLGAQLDVYFGTWCSDSRREMARFWRALDETGSMVAFPIRLIAVDRDKQEPAQLVAGADLRYVPTFIVRRGGEEVGRVVEESPRGIENDLLALLTGRAAGVLSASRPELVTGGETP